MKLTKKQQLEHTAKELFWKHGFKKVTIDEICKKAGVSRKSFYTFYENKIALVQFIIEQEMDQAYQFYSKIASSNIPFALKIEQLFSYKYEFSATISMEFISDFYHPDSAELLQFFQQATQRSMLMMRQLFTDAQATGEMNPTISLDYVMWLMQKTVEYCGSDELMAFFPNADALTRQVTQSLIYGIMPIQTLDA